MSQAGIVDFEGSHPQVPTTFVTNMGTVVPIGNTLEILGTIVAAHSIPLETTGSGNTVTIVTQYSSSAGASVGTNAGLASFSSTYFTVDANGFVNLNGSVIGQTITGNTGGALSPVAGNWNIFGTSTAAGAVPVQTSGTGNTLTVQVQKSQAIASTNAANVGLSAFNSTYFTVDANGFVSLNGASVGETITGNTGGALAPTSGNWNILGTSTAPGTTPVQTSGTGSTLTVQVQKAQAIASTNATNVGLAAFNSTYFSVDANGFVSLVASSVGGHFTVDASTAPGTNPVVPNGSGVVTITGGQVPAGTTVNVIQTNSLAANTYTIQIQRSQAVAASTVGDNGVSHFNSTFFTVDSNGFVSLNGSHVGETITGNTGGALSPTAGNWNILGTSTAAGTTPVQTSGTGSTLTVQVQTSQAIASTNATNIGLAAFNSADFTVDANGFVSLAGGGAGFTTVNIQTFTSSGTYTPTANMAFCIVEIAGGGAGGGGAAATGGGVASLGSGGGSGEIARGVFSAATIGVSQTVTIGAAGAANSGTSGGNGGNSSVGALISANGGRGGVTLSPTFSGGVQGSPGGTGGSGGSFRSPGTSGGSGQTNPGNVALWSGYGGNSPYGAGGADIVSITYPISDSVAGNNAVGYASGGGGAINGASVGAQPGGAGTAGVVIITEYIT